MLSVFVCFWVFVYVGPWTCVCVFRMHAAIAIQTWRPMVHRVCLPALSICLFISAATASSVSSSFPNAASADCGGFFVDESFLLVILKVMALPSVDLDLGLPVHPHPLFDSCAAGLGAGAGAGAGVGAGAGAATGTKCGVGAYGVGAVAAGTVVK